MARKTVKKSPARPIAGGTNNGTRWNRYHYWRTGYGVNMPDRLDFHLTQAGEFHCKPDYLTGNFELTDQTQLFYHLEGQATFEYPGHRLNVQAGDLLIRPPFQTFTYGSQRGAKYHWLALGGDWPRVLGPREIKHYAFGLDDKIEAALVEIREVLILRRPGYPIRAVSGFYELIARLEDLSQNVKPESAYPEVVRNAIVFLRENARGSFSATETARAVGVSPSHLRALFERWLGESPRRFHMGCRIELAKRLLSEQNYSVFEVATHIGFADVHHFSRVFKQMTGVAPSRYMQQQR